MRVLTALIFIFCTFGHVQAQQLNNSEIDFTNPKEYEIGGIEVKGSEKLDPNAIKLLSGLKVGQVVKVPGEQFRKAITNLWDQGLFADVDISYSKIQGNVIFLVLEIEELPRLSKFRFRGVKKNEADDLREDINLYREKIVTKNLLRTTERKVNQYFVDKGFHNVTVDIQSTPDDKVEHHVLLTIDVTKGEKVKIQRIDIEGNEFLSDGKLKGTMAETKEKSKFHPFWNLGKALGQATASIFDGNSQTEPQPIIAEYFSEHVRLNIFKTSKYIEDSYEEDKLEIIRRYRSNGYRDAQITRDSVYKVGDRIFVEMTIDEGNPYYFRNVKIVGNKKYPTELLMGKLAIENGDRYDPNKLSMRLSGDPNGQDISSLYMDDGYLFFQVTPVETYVGNDSVDLEIQIYEGQQATIRYVSLVGNTKTNDHVIMRAIRSRPGQLFSRADIIRSQRELGQLNYFDPETMNVTPKPNAEDATVDIEYYVEEKPSDQIELQGGYGAGRLVGSLGVRFTNFSVRNIFNKDEWRPLPSGDGQQLSLRAQTSGLFYQSYNASFIEPWLGGKKPLSFSLSGFHTIQTNGETAFIKQPDGSKIENDARSHLKITGISVGLGQRLKWPDDYFQFQQSINIQQYAIKDFTQFIFSNGVSNNFFYKATLSRNSLDQFIFPSLGSSLSLSFQATPPYSLLNGKDYSTLDEQSKFRWAEYFKWKATSEWYTKMVGKLVLKTKVGFGFHNFYNNDIGPAPFERFYLGGSGLTNVQFDGREIIALRGYDEQSLSPRTGAMFINKYTAELRYPFSLNPSATIFGLAFLEAGNSWTAFKDFDPFDVYRSAGVGIRLNLAAFGLLGLDWGYRLNDVPTNPGMQRSQLHFTIGMNLGEL